MNRKNKKNILELLKFLPGLKRSAHLHRRVATRRKSSAQGLYKILDRDKFFGKNYEGEKNTMSLLDVSTTGIAFMTEENVSNGDYIEIEVNKLSEHHIYIPPIKAACEAVYSKNMGNSGKRIGVKFLTINPACQDQIRFFSESV